jgi:hypothetical protein
MLTIGGLGTFSIDRNAILGDGNDASVGGKVVFEKQTHAITDEAFVDYFVKESGKFKPLALADIESYVESAKQFLNISKPFIIEGVGTLVNTQRGWEFVAGAFQPPKGNVEMQNNRVSDIPDTSHEKSRAFEDYSRPKPSLKKPLLFLGIVALLGGLGYGAYYLYTKNKSNETVASTKKTEDKNDTTKVDTTSGIKPAPVPVVPNAPKVDSAGDVSYKAVIMVGTKVDAEKRYNKLLDTDSKDRVIIYTTDNTNYKVAITGKCKLADTGTTRLKLGEYFLGASKKNNVVLEY